MAEPQRPASVPAEAHWVETDKEWEFGREKDGKKHGPFFYWRPDGTLCNLCHYHEGQPHGAFYRYHENGELSQRGYFVNGELDGKRDLYRCSTPKTTERSMEGLGATVMRAELFYSSGTVIWDKAYDKDDVLVGSDGKPIPARPASVPEGARYLPKAKVWQTGEVRTLADGRHLKQGLWKEWNAAGVLLLEVEWKDGERTPFQSRYAQNGQLVERVTRHGAGRIEESFTDGGKPTWRIEYDAAGVKTRFESWPMDGFLAVAGGVRFRGGLKNGAPVGAWEVLDAGDKVVWATSLFEGLAEPIGLDHPVLENVTKPATHWARLGYEAVGKGRPYEALLAFARAAGSGERGPLDGFLKLHQIPAGGDPARGYAMHVVELTGKALGRTSPEKAFGVALTSYLEAIVQGGVASVLLRDVAVRLDQMEHHLVSLDFANAVVAMDANVADPYYTRSLVLMSVARMDEARSDVVKLTSFDAEQGAFLGAYLDAVTAPFTYWPSLPNLGSVATARARSGQDAPPSVKKDLPAIQNAVRKSAARLAAMRGALIARGAPASAAWLPPDVALLSGGPEAVNEAKTKVKLDQTVPDLLAAARGEWFKLCLLCHVGGASGPVMPNGPIASDASRMLGIVEFWTQATEGVAGGEEAPAIPLWHGVSLDTIAPAVVQYQLMAIPKAGFETACWLVSEKQERAAA